MSAFVATSAVPQPGETTAFAHSAGDICGWRIGPLTIQFATVTAARKWLAECVNTLNATEEPAENAGVAMGCAAGSVFDSCDGDQL